MWLDILTGTILIIAILQGFRNGFIKAVISFFSLMSGLILACQFAGWVASFLKEHTKIAAHWLPFISFLVILVIFICQSVGLIVLFILPDTKVGLLSLLYCFLQEYFLTSSSSSLVKIH